MLFLLPLESSCDYVSRQLEAGKMPTVHLLDYVAGNVRSLVNAIEKLGYDVDWIKTPEDVARADVCLLVLSASQLHLADLL